jgi:hypothetical protein
MAAENNLDLSSLNNLSAEERAFALKILEEYATNDGTSKLLDDLRYADYQEIPVDIITFIKDSNYLGNAWHTSDGKCKLFPYWEKRLKELFPDNITTAVNNAIFSGARGLGKSEVAVAIGAYLMYRVMCLKNPHDHFNLKPTEKLTFAFMNITKELAESIGISKFQNTIKLSPWFLNHGTLSGRDNVVWNPPNYIEIVIGSQASHVIGKPVLFAFFDEISFIRNQDIDKQKQKAMDMIDTAIGGMKTRFFYKGHSPALLVLASSKRSEKSFLEVHMKKKVESEKDNVLIVDEPVWNIRPADNYSGKRFNVALGNKFLTSQVLSDSDTDLDFWKNRGYKILSVPIEFRADFLDDIDRALCDFAGISSSEITKYISGAAVQDIKNPMMSNPFTKDIIEVGNGKDDTTQYYDFFDFAKVPKSMMTKPLFIHLDMSVSGDMTGISGVWIKGKKPSVDELSQSNDLYYQLAFSVSVKAPKGRQISFQKNKNFIYWLKERGFKIKGISTDSFQSVETGQDLTAKGYNYKQISVDRVENTTNICRPYQYFRTSIYEKRVEIYDSRTLIDEITDLERNMNTGRIDHPDGGRKDVCDAVCGAIFHASQYAEEFAYDYGENIEATISLNQEASYDSDMKQIAIDFELEMQKLLDPVITSVKNSNGGTQSFDDNSIITPTGAFVSDGCLIW